MLDLVVFVITYNHEKFIEDCIYSIINQNTKYSYKIFVSDDCSTDRTQKILKRIKREYPDMIEIFLRKQNVGARKNLVEGLYYIKNNFECKYIATIDGDDLIYKDKIEKQINFMKNNPEVVLSHHNMKLVNEDRTEVLKYFNSRKHPKYTTIKDLAIKGNFICNSSKMFLKDALPDKFKYKERIRNLDFITIMQIVRDKKIGFLNETLGEYRIHSSSIRREEKNLNTLFYFYRGDLYSVYLSKKFIEKRDFLQARNRVYLMYAKKYRKLKHYKNARKLLRNIDVNLLTPKQLLKYMYIYILTFLKI